MIRRGHDHRVHILAFQHPAEILDAVRVVLPVFLDLLDALRDPRVVDVADHRAIDIVIAQKGRQVALAHPAGADQAHPDLFVRADGGSRRSRAGENESAEQRRGRGRRGGSHEFPSRN